MSIYEEKVQFLSKMSHDMRTPINAIMGMLHIAQTHRDDEARVDDCLKKIEISTNYLLTLLNEMLEVNKPESGKPEEQNEVSFRQTQALTEQEPVTKLTDGLKDVHILLVEDNEMNMEIAQVILEEAGAVTTPARNGRLAVELFEDTPAGTFDVILMDIMMPEMDGLEATRTIRAMNRDDAKTIPIIAMTANTFSEDYKKSEEAGMDAHIAKPLNMPLLAGTVAKLLK